MNLDPSQNNPNSNVIPLKPFHRQPVLSNQPNTDSTKRDFNGPISRQMWTRVSSLGSTYPDSFDWAVYDRLYEKFRGKVKNDNVVFGTTFRLVNHLSGCSKCHYSFELDTYGRGCVHDCGYCYAKDSLTIRGYWNKPIPFPVDLSEIRRVFYQVFETDKPSRWREILEKRVPLRIGSMSDSFMWMEKRIGVTRELLKILKFYNYPNVIFTRSDLIATDEYISLLDPSLTTVQFSISSDNEDLTAAVEPGAPGVERRLKALRKLADAGIWTAARINPLFPTYPDGYFTDEKSIIERFGSISNVPKLGLLDISQAHLFLDQLKHAGVKTVLVGFVRLSHFAIKNLTEATGVPIRSFFRKDIPQGAKDMHYSDSEINYYYKVLHSKASKLGLRFSTCYIGNGIKDYYQHQDLWTNKSDCCDVLSNVQSFKTTAQAISWTTREKYSPNKGEVIKAQEIEKDLDHKHLLASRKDTSTHPFQASLSYLDE